MKLKSLAALIVRIIGVLYFFYGISDALDVVLDTHKFTTLTLDAGSLILGYGLIHYSKKLAALFCKGLDDDTP